MKRIILLIAGLAIFTFKNQAQTVTDIDGNNYNVVTIDKQYWMKEDLKVTHYANGDSISNVSDSILWSNLKTGAWCYQNNVVSLNENYGKLYNYYTVIDPRGLCPEGWHMPYVADIKQLIYSIGGILIAGGKLKDTTNWEFPNLGADNSSGFSAIPSYIRFPEGIFGNPNYIAVWWLSDQKFDTEANIFSLYADRETASYGSCSKNYGFTIRCLSDSSIFKDIPDSLFFLTKEKISQPKIKVYPNPANDILFIDNYDSQTIEMQVYNMIGECVLQKVLDKGVNRININAFSKGIFIVKLSAIDWTIQRKLTKQ